jgi:hypothetical protein
VHLNILVAVKFSDDIHEFGPILKLRISADSKNVTGRLALAALAATMMLESGIKVPRVTVKVKKRRNMTATPGHRASSSNSSIIRKY